MKLDDKEQEKSPFSRIFEKSVAKFKIKFPADHKRSCGGGKVSIHKGVFTSGDKTVYLFKVVFKNPIGKILYDGSIQAAISKCKKIEEKSYKNQFRIGVVYQDPQTKKITPQYCLINFNRNEDLEEFAKCFKDAMETLKAAAPK